MKSILFLFCLLAIFPTNYLYAQAPGGVTTNNRVWLKANLGVTLGPTSNVTLWNEYSGASVTGNFSTHSPGAGGLSQQQPTLLPAGINFNPYIVFVSTNRNCVSSNTLINGNQIFDPQQMTMFQVLNLHTASGTGVWCKWQTSNTAPGRLGNEVNNGGATTGKIRLDFRGTTLRSNTVVTNNSTLYTSTSNATSMLIRLNGTQDVSTTVSALSNQPGTGRLSLGNENEAGGDSYPTSVDIAEFILFNRALTSTEINRVESYLAVKYGFTLTQIGTSPNNYLSSDGTVIWTNASNAPYYNNITGIGADDIGATSSGLQQKQSKSINPNALVTIYNATYGAGVFPLTNETNTNTITTPDNTFLLFGDNMGDTSFTSCADGGAISRIGRVWKVQETGGHIGNVTLTINNNTIPGAETLLISSDPTFSTVVTAIPLQNNGTVKYAAYDFASNQYFTFGTLPIELNAVVTSAICSGDASSVVLNPSGGSTPYTYTWNSSPVQTSATLSGVPSGHYDVVVTHGSGCQYTEGFDIISDVVPISANVTTTNSICTAKNGKASFTASGGTGPYTFDVDNTGSFSSANNRDELSSGTHTLAVKDANGCNFNTTFIVNNTTSPVTYSIDSTNAFCDRGGVGGVITIKVNVSTSTAPYTYSWQNYGAVTLNELKDLRAGDYAFTVTDANGCKGNGNVTLIEIPCCKLAMPTAFSPNGDGLNDKFRPMFSIVDVQYSMKIYNRWGELVFKETNTNKGWDGTIRGEAAGTGVYFYKMTYFCNMGDTQYEQHGDITLIR